MSAEPSSAAHRFAEARGRSGVPTRDSAAAEPEKPQWLRIVVYQPSPLSPEAIAKREAAAYEAGMARWRAQVRREVAEIQALARKHAERTR